MTSDKNIIHRKTFNIAWGDMDALGHVNNARYFDYFQEARIEWLSELNLGLTDQIGPVVIQVGCTFFKPVIYPATVEIRTNIHSLGNTSFNMDYDLYQGDSLMAHGTSKIVWIDYTKQKSVPIPEIIRGLFEQHTPS